MVEFGVQVSNLQWEALRDRARAIEDLGYDILVLPDHLVWEGPERARNESFLAFDPVTQAAVAAEATKRLRIGHLVLCNLFRHPVFTAQAITSLDHLSGGRAFLGLGTGWTETEFRMFGLSFPDIGTRLRMLDEALTVIRSLWTQETTTFAGEFYRLSDASIGPRPVQQPHPPILVGGGGKGLLRVAGRHADVLNLISEVGRDGYIALKGTRRIAGDQFVRKVAFAREEAVRAERDPKSIRISEFIMQVTITDSAAHTRALAEGTAGVLGFSPEDVLRFPLFLMGTPDECVAELRRRVREWEVREIVFGGSLDETTLRQLTEKVLKHVH